MVAVEEGVYLSLASFTIFGLIARPPQAFFPHRTVEAFDVSLLIFLVGPRYPVPAEAAHSFWGGSYGGGRYNAHPREPQATVGNPAGRAFKGTHGNGTLTPPADWPKNDAVGVGVHGGQEAACGIDELKGPFWCTSCRMNAATVVAERNKIHGFRGARTAPDEAKWNSVRGEEESSPVLLGLPLSRE